MNLYNNNVNMTPNLYNILNESSKFKSNFLYPMQKNQGVYLVRLKLLNKDNANLYVYNYIYYHHLFAENLILYLITKPNFLNSNVYLECNGTFILILDDFFSPLSSTIYEAFNLENTSGRFDEYIEELKKIKIKPNYKKHSWEVFKSIRFLIDPKTEEFFEGLINEFNSVGLKYQYYDKNININRFVENSLFVVNDLEDFVNNVNKSSYSINGGPQKWRAQINSTSQFLHALDTDYRNELRKNYEYHYKNGNSYGYLPSDAFSFHNIHVRLGNVRY